MVEAEGLMLIVKMSMTRMIASTGSTKAKRMAFLSRTAAL